MPRKPANPPPTERPKEAKRSAREGLGSRAAGEPITVKLHTVTPVLGGGTRTRHVDAIDFVRAPSIRGHLRFWWRALHAAQYKDSAELFKREMDLWGGVAGTTVKRSAVEVAVQVADSPRLANSDIDQQAKDAYALWPARAEKKKDVPPAERWENLAWTLTVRVPEAEHQQVRRAVNAWILFGGYGGRTRRGCGTMTIDGDRKAWLPEKPSLAEIRALLGEDIFGPPTRAANDLPLLQGAILKAGDPTGSAAQAWYAALGWLRDFRQRPADDKEDNDLPRDPKRDKRPGQSRWPEADKLRHLHGSWSHAPRHGDRAAWPRAAFGLPLVTRFKNQGDPPGQWEVVWRRGEEVHDRLGSPLILKPLALRDGRFVPIALWLHRAYPAGGEVVARRQGGAPINNSAAAFDVLLGDGDEPLYKPLVPTKAPPGEQVKTAFFEWLGRHHPGVKRVT